MKFTLTKHAANQEKTDCLILGVFEDNTLTAIGKTLNKATNQYLTKFFKNSDFQGKVGSTVLLHNVQGITCNKLLLVGLGEHKQITALSFSKSIKAAFSAIKTLPLKSVSCYLTEIQNKQLPLPTKTKGCSDFLPP